MIAIPAQFQRYSNQNGHFYDGLAAVTSKDGQTYYIDSAGTQVVDLDKIYSLVMSQAPYSGHRRCDGFERGIFPGRNRAEPNPSSPSRIVRTLFFGKRLTQRVRNRAHLIHRFRIASTSFCARCMASPASIAPAFARER